MYFSYKRFAAGTIALTFVISLLLIIIAGRSAADIEKTGYILKEYNGTVALYKGEERVEIYDGIVISNLPYADKKRFFDGISVDSVDEAEMIIEDYDG